MMRLKRMGAVGDGTLLRPGRAHSAGAGKVMALSVRQPWAWLLVNGFKDVENREFPTRFRGRLRIHAGQTCTKADYEACVLFVQGLPAPDGDVAEHMPTWEESRKMTGGFVGEVEVVDCVLESKSPWFCGTFGFMVANGKPAKFEAARGKLGFWRVQ